MTLALSLIISRGMLENMGTAIISSSQMGDIYIENFNQTILQRLFGGEFGGELGRLVPRRPNSPPNPPQIASQLCLYYSYLELI